jgi:hypothetical protein
MDESWKDIDKTKGHGNLAEKFSKAVSKKHIKIHYIYIWEIRNYIGTYA